MARRPSRRTAALPLLALVLLLALASLPAGPSGTAGAATPTARASVASAVTGNISGPSLVGVGLKANYKVEATGGAAIAANGTQVGVFSYTASLIGTNTSSAVISPPQGVLVNGSVSLQLVAPNLTQSATLYVDITSSYQGTNSSTNLSFGVTIVQPTRLSTNLLVVGPGGIKSFALTIELDGVPVGSVSVPSLTQGQTYPVSFSYVSQGLSAGWHTFTLSLAQEHGLVLFPNGLESYSVSFYVPGPAPDYSLWYLAGAVAFVGVVFIWVTRVGARRRTKSKS